MPRDTAHDFIRVGNRWINMSMVTDVTDGDDKLYVYLAAPMLARGKDEVETAGRRIVVEGAEEIKALKQWLNLND